MQRVLALFSFLLVSLLTTTAPAETFYLTKSHPGGTNWSTAGYWSETGNPGAHSGADYLVDSGLTMRTPENASAASVTTNTFPGDSLTLGGNRTGSLTAGQITLKSNCTYNNMTVVSGAFANGLGDRTYEVAGNINVTGKLTFSCSNNDKRAINVSAKLTGGDSSSLTLTSDQTGYIRFSNPGNTFSGSISVPTNAKFYLYDPTGKSATNGSIGSNPTLMIAQGASLYTKESLSLKSATISYASGATYTGATRSGISYLTATLPTATTQVSTAAMQTALKAAGLNMEVGQSLAVTNSSRTAATYYFHTDTSQDSLHGWNRAAAWTVGSATGATSTVVPTLGDTAIVTSALRTVDRGAGAAATYYFLATTCLKTGGELGLKAVNGLDYLPDLILDGGKVSHYGADKTEVHLGGHITVQSASTLTSNNSNGRVLDVQSDIEGSAPLSIAGGATVKLGGNNTGYTGTMTVTANTTLQATSANALTNATIVLQPGSKIKVADSQKIGSWTAQYSDGQTTYHKQLMPNSIKVSDSYTREALQIVGMDAPLNAEITSSSARAGKTYYLNDTKATTPSGTSWNSQEIWFDDAGYTTKSSYIPTVGDVAYVSNTMRTPTTNDVNGKTHYFLAETHLQKNGTLGLKNQNATVYFPNLILEGGSIGNAINGTNKLDGNIRVVADSTISPMATRAVNVLSDISGSASLTFGGTGSIILSGANSGFSGKTTLATNTTLQLDSQNALGSTGDLTTQTGTKLIVNKPQELSKLTVNGMLNLSGQDVLEVPAITGTGVTLNQTGGTLYLTDTEPIFNGNYNQTGGALRLDLDSKLTVTGNLALSSIEVNSDDASLFKTDEIYQVLSGPNVSKLDWTGISVTGVGELANQSLRGMVQNGVFYFGTSGTIANHVPEPAT